ncbi:MAG: HU family DNA-binding protein [Desulfovibrio sp.]|jgi:DNA-binding protein HU-beta|nr:HU family DNA-binding protein [Desulfovibrio sp.]
MTKAELITIMVEKDGKDGGVSKAHMGSILDVLGDVIAGELLRGGDITLPGLGKLCTVERAARTGRNPKTGASIQVPAKKTVKFKAGKELKEKLNQGQDR